MPFSRRNVLKTGGAVAVSAQVGWFGTLHSAIAATQSLHDTLSVHSANDPEFSSAMARSFASAAAHPLVKALLPSSFLIRNSTLMPVTSVSGELWVTSGDDQFCVPKIIQVATGKVSIYSAHRPVLPANSGLLITPFFSITQSLATSSDRSFQIAPGSSNVGSTPSCLAQETSVTIQHESLPWV